VHETETLRLWAETKNGNFIVENKMSGKCFWGLPEGIDDDPIAVTRHKRIMRSHLSVQYLDAEEGQTYTANSYMDSVDMGGLKQTVDGSGVTLAFSFPETDLSITLKIGLQTANGLESLFVEIIEISEPERFRILNIDVLPFFGAASMFDDGYIFVPDGAGALIRLNNGKTYARNYSQRVYGADKTVTIEQQTRTEESARLPVFGICAGSDAFIGIIEAGDSLADIMAGVSGINTSYNNVYSRFIVRGRDIFVLGSTASAAVNHVFQNGALPNETFAIRYLFQHGNDADPSGMARAYRDYLKCYRSMAERHITPSLLLQFYGALTVNRSVVGIPMNKKESMTTFAQAEQIVRSLADAGANDLAVRFLSWDRADISMSTPKEANAERILGGNKGLLRLNDMLAEYNIPFFADIEFAYYEKGAKNAAAKLIVNLPAKQPAFDLANGFENRNLPLGYYLNLVGLSEYPYRYLHSFPSGMGISLGMLGNALYSDYTIPENTRQDTARRFEDIARTASAKTSVLVSSGNAYALPYADFVCDIPMSSSGYNVTDMTFPFYQIALNGLVPFCGTPINESANPERAALLSLAWGCSISFRVAASVPDIIKNSRHNAVMAADYALWEEDILRWYGMMKDVERITAGSRLMSVDILQNGVYLSVFENGAKLYTNINSREVLYKGHEIPPMSIQELDI
jgi:hypothetical protein